MHVVQHPTDATPSTVAEKSWQQICDIANYPGRFSPSQYATASPCPGFTSWPLCDSVRGPAPDLGFRYPLVADGAATRLHQDPAQDWWSVCANSDLSTIQAVPGVQDCGADPFVEEVGRCQASAAYYEKLNKTGQYPAESFYGFVLTHPDCDACGHELLSVIETCKATCRHYFFRLGFDQDGSDPDNPGNGVWRDEDDPAWDERPPGKRFADVALRSTPIASGPHAGRSSLTACEDFCGPPNTERPSPPWVSSSVPTARRAAEKNNQWYFTLYQRPRNPNQTLAGALRTYAVNVDHSSPTRECNAAIIGRYCETIITASTLGGATRDEKRVQCRKNLLPARVDLEGDGEPDGAIVLGDWDLSRDGFCDAFSHANLFCRDVCYDAGGNGEITDNVCGFTRDGVRLQTGVLPADCDHASALCQCSDGLGHRGSCLSLCGDGPGAPGETGLQCDDGNVLDGDCCAANCLFEPVGATCGPDGS